jgi:hypothetical protein
MPIAKSARKPNAALMKQKHRIVNKLFVTLITENDCSLFIIPRTFRENSFSNLTPSILRAAKEPLCDVMV